MPDLTSHRASFVSVCLHFPKNSGPEAKRHSHEEAFDFLPKHLVLPQNSGGFLLMPLQSHPKRVPSLRKRRPSQPSQVVLPRREIPDRPGELAELPAEYHKGEVLTLSYRGPLAQLWLELHETWVDARYEGSIRHQAQQDRSGFCPQSAYLWARDSRQSKSVQPQRCSFALIFLNNTRRDRPPKCS